MNVKKTGIKSWKNPRSEKDGNVKKTGIKSWKKPEEQEGREGQRTFKNIFLLINVFSQYSLCPASFASFYKGQKGRRTLRILKNK